MKEAFKKTVEWIDTITGEADYRQRSTQYTSATELVARGDFQSWEKEIDEGMKLRLVDLEKWARLLDEQNVRNS